MTLRDTLAAVSVAVVWALTFIVIKVGVAETSPPGLSALRFVFAAYPAFLFVGPPKPPRKVALSEGEVIAVRCREAARGSRSGGGEVRDVAGLFDSRATPRYSAGADLLANSSLAA